MNLKTFGIISIILPMIPIIFITGCAKTYPTYPYYSSRPEYSYFDKIGLLTARTKDGYTVSAEIILGYDLNDNEATEELNGKRDELRIYIRGYFNKKNRSELAPEKENKLKSDIRKQLNTHILKTAKIRLIIFNILEVH